MDYRDRYQYLAVKTWKHDKQREAAKHEYVVAALGDF